MAQYPFQLFCILSIFLTGCTEIEESQEIAGAGANGTGMAVVGTTKPKVVDFDFKTPKSDYPPLNYSQPYPAEAKAQKIQGIVIVKIKIDLNGYPISAQALEGPEILREYAEQYVLQLKFTPRERSGKLIAYETLRAVNFKL